MDAEAFDDGGAQVGLDIGRGGGGVGNEVGVVEGGEAFGAGAGVGEGRGVPEVFRVGSVKFYAVGSVWGGRGWMGTRK